MNQICNLASSGLNQYSYYLLATIILLISVSLCMYFKRGVKAWRLLPVLLLLIGLSVSKVTFAGHADCIAQSKSDNTASNVVSGFLINDSPQLESQLSGFSVIFNVLDNDNAPDGDPLNPATLELSGIPFITNSLGFKTYLILDPEQAQTLPDPDSPWKDFLPANIWGYWEPILTCDDVDEIYCESTPTPGETYCLDNSTGACYTNGEVKIFLSEDAPAQHFSINYTASTLSGLVLSPAVINVSLPPTITAQDGNGYLTGTCGSDAWDEDWSFNVMTHVTTTGSSPLLASTIDLDLNTAGIQDTVSKGIGTELTIYSVDANGIVTVSFPNAVDELDRHPNYGFEYTISDTEGNTSNIAEGLIIEENNNCG